jgi:ketosteroid isomerase-like protein
MPSANAETIERLYAVATSAAGLDYYDPSVEWDMSHYAGWADTLVYRGKQGVQTFMRSWLASFDRWEATIERLVDAGDDVIAVVQDRAYLKGSSAPIRRRYAHVFRFRDGLIVYAAIHSDVEAAIASLDKAAEGSR